MKAPVPGKVKTRLVPLLTHAQAAELYRGWCRAIFARVRNLENAYVTLAYAPEPTIPEPDWLCDDGSKPDYFLQKGTDLGERIRQAFEHAFALGYRRAAAIGTDSPDLPVSYIKAGFAALARYDVTIGPAEDGGYYLVGLNQPLKPGLFEGIDWSTKNVFQQTLQKARGLSLKVHILPEHYDVDTPDDLRRIDRGRS